MVEQYLRTHRELVVWTRSFDLGMELFEITKSFPRAETYSLTDQMRRSSRSVAANIAEAWRKRRYRAAFVAKLSDAETEAAETQVWIEFAIRCGYLEQPDGDALIQRYEQLISTIVGMIANARRWTFPR